MIRGHDSGYDSRKCNMHVIINFVYAISGNTHIYLHVEYKPTNVGKYMMGTLLHIIYLS